MERKLMSTICRCTISALLVFVIAASGSSGHASEGDVTGNLNFFLGSKTLEKDDWAPLDEQGEIGIKVDFKKKDWPLSIAIDLMSSAAMEDNYFYIPGYGTSYYELEGYTSELGLGVRKIWDGSPSIRPFIGGGVAIISGEIEARTGFVSISDSDSSMGLWIEWGVYWAVTEHLNLGFDMRFSDAEIELFGVEGEAGGGHFGALIGYHW